MSTAEPPMRADAQRNRAAILEAATSALTADPRASMVDIARQAGVGRVTLYGHFPSRTELVDAVFAHNMRRAEAHLGAVDLTGDPRTALERLVSSSWREIADSHGVLEAAEQELGGDRVRAHHDDTLHRVRALLARGQAAGAFRDDVSADWLTSCAFAVLHLAAAEIRAGRLTEPQAPGVVSTTVLAIVDRPGR
ncbi:TetR/AcrR family transcriptional regulator [Cellulomonas sp.]|uniref:TetR/AcrR family transcriptional regulator n=1 Tax=Cellulomonas sp. TaxID=40001 RepID=UPI001B12D926|nr:TetR/AcrR family transcriptional regulator [Cellulomonas sp.]MBO9553679.1 TetR/AcrR family transcriptional regulator [Cellulomonas sp.]